MNFDTVILVSNTDIPSKTKMQHTSKSKGNLKVSHSSNNTVYNFFFQFKFENLFSRKGLSEKAQSTKPAQNQVCEKIALVSRAVHVLAKL